MEPQNENLGSQNTNEKSLFYRLSQFVGLLLGAKVFVTILLTFALYVSTYFLFNQEESLKDFVFDFKVHGIIFCSVLSILAGGIINQFYDREKDRYIKPFRTQLQSFLAQKYYLYSYLVLNTVSLVIAYLISPRVFVFFLVYQFLIWFYSHKLSKVLIINNLTFVILTLYPFFGMLVYYRTFSTKIMLMAIFLFLILLAIDVIKDQLTKDADSIFGYRTIANTFSPKLSRAIIIIILLGGILTSLLLILGHDHFSVMTYYFLLSISLFLVVILFEFKSSAYYRFIAVNLLRIWVFLGILCMLIDGIVLKF